MKIFVPVLAMSALLASTVAGWSSEGKLLVKLTINPECNINPGGNDSVVSFRYASIDSIRKGDVTSEVSSIKVQCTAGTTYYIALGAGENAGDTVNDNNRKMRNGASNFYIPYDLYMDSNYNTHWGHNTNPGKDGIVPKDGVLGDIKVVKSEGAVDTIPVYGRIKPYSGALTAGDYNDKVTVTVSF